MFMVDMGRFVPPLVSSAQVRNNDVLRAFFVYLAALPPAQAASADRKLGVIIFTLTRFFFSYLHSYFYAEVTAPY